MAECAPNNDAVTSLSWAPSASLALLRRRAQFLTTIRQFFAERDVFEVETPILSCAGTTDPHIESFATQSLAGGQYFLHTSPEFPMKRLLAAGSGPIYQLCRVFRNGDCGRIHNPEFTMLEWYRPGWDYHQLMAELDALAQLLLGTQAADRLTYADTFRHYTELDPHTADASQFRQCARQRGINLCGDLGDNVDAWRDLLLTHLVEPHLGVARPVFIFDYPASQAALARTRDEKIPVAERFELYYRGVELANGYQELIDPIQQRARFEADCAIRKQAGLRNVCLDENLIAALQHGMPESSGVAVGIDRLFMLGEGIDRIDEVIAFSWEQA